MIETEKPLWQYGIDRLWGGYEADTIHLDRTRVRKLARGMLVDALLAVDHLRFMRQGSGAFVSQDLNPQRPPQAKMVILRL